MAGWSLSLVGAFASSRRAQVAGACVGALALTAAFLAPHDSGFGPPQDTWTTALGTAAAIIGGAPAVVFALLVLVVQNAAARYSPIFLRYIGRDSVIRGVFGWTVISLVYALACLGFGVTPWRVAAASVLAVSVVVALGLVALRVLKLLSPIELASIVEADMTRALAHGMAAEAERFANALAAVGSLVGRQVPGGTFPQPVPKAVVDEMQDGIYPLLSISGSAAEHGQVDVQRGVLGSVTAIVRSYLLARGTNAGFDDPLVARTSEELFSLAQSATNATSLQALPEVVRALGRLATAGVEVSSPGIGLGERNVAMMPIGHLTLIAIASMSNINSIAPKLATEQLGGILHQLLDRGLPSSTAGAIERELAPVMVSALRPYAHHVTAEGARWLMRLWSASSTNPGGYLVRAKIDKVVETLLTAYRQQPGAPDRHEAIAPLVDLSSSPLVPLPMWPAGAAVSTAFLTADWPPDRRLLEDARRLADNFVRELLWPAAAGEWKDFTEATDAMHQALETAAVLGAIAGGTLRHPRLLAASVPANEARTSTQDVDEVEIGNNAEEDGDDGLDGRALVLEHTQEEAAKHWWWLTTIMLGTCRGLADAPSEDAVTNDRWDAYIAALDGACASISVALASQSINESVHLGPQLEKVLQEFCELAEKLQQAWGSISALSPVIRYLRMVGAWLLATAHQDLAERAAHLIAAASTPGATLWDAGDHWRRRYPTERFGSGDWQGPIISVAGQQAVPFFWQRHPFQDETWRDRFDTLVDELTASSDEPASARAADTDEVRMAGQSDRAAGQASTRGRAREGPRGARTRR